MLLRVLVQIAVIVAAHAAGRLRSASASRASSERRWRACGSVPRSSGGRRRPRGTSERLFREFDTRGVFSIDELGPGPWMTLETPDGIARSTGLSLSQLDGGDSDPVFARMVLGAAIDYYLNAPAQHRASAVDLEQMFRLLRRASAVPPAERDLQARRYQ